jgi:chitodextrinase/uncharacterized protein YjdB
MKLHLILALNLILLSRLLAISPVITKSTDIPLQPVHNIDGAGWANPVATSLITGNIYWGYIDPDLRCIVACRFPNGNVIKHVVIEAVQNNDNHAEISIGLDNDGYIHLLGGQHNSSPIYYVSRNPEDISSWQFRGNNTAIGGIEGIQITYQCFYRSNNGTLFLGMRSNLVSDFVTGARGIALGRYNCASQKWEMIGGRNYSITDSKCITHKGADSGSLTAFVWNPSGVGDMRPAAGKCYSLAHYQGYMLKVVFDKNNGMHVTYNMADSINIDYAKSDVSRFLTHVFYAYSPDEGSTWFKANGEQITSFPITKANGDVVYKRVPTGYIYPAVTDQQNMANANDITIDSDGKPVIFQTIYPSNSTSTSYAFKWNGTRWQNVSAQKTNVNTNLFYNPFRDEVYNFGENNILMVSNDNMKTWNRFYEAIQSNWYICVDKYLLQKTGKVRYYNRSDASGRGGISTFEITDGAASPTISPNGGIISYADKISITNNQSGATIYYTTDGSNPVPETSQVYTEPFTLAGDCVVKAVAIADGISPSSVVEFNFFVTKGMKYPVAGVTASAYQSGTTNVPENTLDGNLTTRWSMDGEQWIMFDLGQKRDITNLFMSFYGGDARQAIFDLLISDDGQTWTTVASDKRSGGLTSGYEKFSFPYSARYIRYNGHGNTTSAWNSVQEVQIWGCANQQLLNITAINGKTNPAAGAYCQNSQLIVKAIPDPGYIFDRWTGDVSSTENPITVVLSKDVTLQALFVDNPACVTPKLSLTGTSQGVSIALTGDTPGSSIRYTTDGSNPTETSGMLYSAAFQVSEKTTIKAISYREGKSNSDVLIYNYQPISAISFNPPALNLVTGSSIHVFPEILPVNATVIDSVWISSDTSIVKVEKSGKLTATDKTGNATIQFTAPNGNVSAIILVNVIPQPVDSIRLSKKTFQMTEIVNSGQLSVTIYPANAFDKSVVWKSTDANVVTVNSNGMLTPVKPGNAKIIVTSNSGLKADTCELQVLPALIVYEPFDYPVDATGVNVAGNANSGNGTPYNGSTEKGTGCSGSWGNNAKVVSPGLSYSKNGTDLATISNAMLTEGGWSTTNFRVYRWLPNDPYVNYRINPNRDFGAAKKVLWMSLILKTTDAAKTNRIAFQTTQSGHNMGGNNFYVGQQNGKWGVSTGGGGIVGTAATANSPAYLLLKISYGADTTVLAKDDTIKCWVNPDLAGTLPTPSGTITGFSANFSTIQTRCETAGFQMTVDELRIGLNREAVSPFGDNQPPARPSSLTASAISHNSFVLSWSPSIDNVAVKMYEIYKNGIIIGTTTTASYTVSGLTPGESVTMNVKAIDVTGLYSLLSDNLYVTTILTDLQAPTVPTALSAPVKSDTSFKLTWTASTDNVGVSGYSVYLNGLYNTFVSSSPVVISGLIKSTTYKVKIQAVDAAGNKSAFTTEISVTTNATANSGLDVQSPTVPVGLQSTNVTSDAVMLSWNASTDNVSVSGYEIFRNDSLVAKSSSLTTTVYNLLPTQTYKFSVRAFDSSGNFSALSAPVTVTTAKVKQFISGFEYLPVKTFKDEPFEISPVGGSSGNPVILTSSNPLVASCGGRNGTTITILKSGKTTISANQAGSLTHEAATTVFRELIVNKAKAGIQLSNLTYSYDGLPHKPTAITTPAGLKVDFFYDGYQITPVNSGTYNCIAKVNDEQYDANDTVSLVINKVPLMIRALDYFKPYGQKLIFDTIPSHRLFEAIGLKNTDQVKNVVITSIGADANAAKGQYPMIIQSVVGIGLSNNYNLTTQNAKLTVIDASSLNTLRGNSFLPDVYQIGNTVICKFNAVIQQPTARLFDLKGCEIPVDFNYMIDGLKFNGQLIPGIYVLRISGKESIATVKFILQ